MKFSLPGEGRLTFALTCGVLLWGAGLLAQRNSPAPLITQPVDEARLVTLRGNTHPLARPEFDQGAAPEELPMQRMLLLLMRSAEQEAALRKLLDEQQIKSSPLYHRWLTPEEFGRQFGPADADIEQAKQWLSTHGFQLNRVAVGRTIIEFSGTARQVRESLHTEIHKYSMRGEAYWANASDPKIPAALAPLVAGVVSLNNFPRQRYHRLAGTFEWSKMTGQVRPLFTFPSPQSGNSIFAVGPNDFGTIYNARPLWSAGTNGTGETIAIAQESNIDLQDVRDFRSLFGLPAKDPQIILDGPDPGVLGGVSEAEADLDTEWSGAAAPGATIDLVVAQSTESTFGGDLSAVYIIDNNLAPVMSVSFGACEAFLGTTTNDFYNRLWQQGATQGITIVVASGDTGSAGCDSQFFGAAQYGLAVNGLGSTPFNVAAGGTDFDDAANLSTYWSATNNSTLQSSALSYIPEQTWNDSCAAAGKTTGCATLNPQGLDVIGGGGGPSNCALSNGTFCMSGYAKPAWQTGTGVPGDGVRDIPDISLFSANGSTASTSFYVFCQRDANTGTGSSTSFCDLNAPYLDFQGAGGTSFAAPIFAGVMAMVVQKTGERQGNANYVLYPLAAQSGATCASNSAAVGNAACVFYDVVTGNNSVACYGGSLNCSNPTFGNNEYGILVDSANSASPAWISNPGYDLASGLGSVNIANLVNQWSSVSFAPTTTALALSTVPPTNPLTVTHGQPVNVSAQVSSASGGTPTGAVSLIAATGPTTARTAGVASFALANGAASGSTNFLPGGTYNVTAHYAGNGTFGASDSAPPIQVTVSPEPSATHVHLINGFFPLSFTATNALYGDFFVRADVTNASSNQLCTQYYEAFVYPCPSGEVTLAANGQPLPNGNGTSPSAYALNSSGYTEDQFPPLSPGTYDVTANYSGDSSYQASSSTVTLTIAKGPTFTYLFPFPAGGNSVTLEAYVETVSTGTVPSGTVQFKIGGQTISGSVTYQGTAYTRETGIPSYLIATLTTKLAASANIAAQYSGDSNYAASTSTATQVLAPDFVLGANPSSLTVASPGQSAASAISVDYDNGFTGTVNLTCGTPSNMTGATCTLNPISLNSAGSLALLLTTTAPPSTGNGFNKPIRFLPGGLALFGLLLLFAASEITRMRGVPPLRTRGRLALGIFLTALLVAALAACGGGNTSANLNGGGKDSSGSGTPAGNYTLIVTGTSGGVPHSVQINVNVQ